MNRINAISGIILFVMAGYGEVKSQVGNNDLIIVDVTKRYSPKKELILQDFMDVEYVQLEINDDFVNQGIVMDVGEEIIIVRNRVNDGDIFVYDRHGKALRKINHKGQGPGEYASISTITLDEEKGEMFISDSQLRKILVYDLYGKFKRSFNQKEGISSRKEGQRTINEYIFYTEIFDYDKDNLICYSRFRTEDIGFDIISKQDGSITKEIKIPVKDKNLLRQTLMYEVNGALRSESASPPQYSIIPCSGNWTLLEISSDTVYTLLLDYSSHPFIVRTPSVRSMNPEVILLLRLVSDRYYFMETIKNEYDFSTRSGFPQTFFMYDKQEKTFSGYIILNSDFLIKKEVYMIGFSPVNHKITACYPLEASQLVESYKKGELKDGKLKDIASKLDEEDNRVIMLIKHKKQ